MKKYLLLTATTSIFATTLALYPDMAYVEEVRHVRHGVIAPLPRRIVEDSIYLGCDAKRFIFDRGGFDLKRVLHIGQEVEFLHEKKRLKGTILSLDPLIVRADRLYFDLSFKDLLIKDLPSGYQLQPSLRLDTDSKSCKISYLVRGIGFESRYVIQVGEKLHLQGYFDIKNESALRYENAKIRFLTGKPNRAERVVLRKSMAMSAPMIKAPKRIEGYFIYELPQRVTLRKGRESLKFLDRELPYKEELVRVCDDLHYNFGTLSYKFDRKFTFEAPDTLPSALVRVYQKGLFLGEDYIADTPMGKWVSLRLGEDFEVTMTKKLKEYTNTKTTYRSVVEYTFTNPKPRSVELQVVEHLPTTTLRFSCKGMKCEKKDARSLLIRIEVPPRSSKKGFAIYQYSK